MEEYKKAVKSLSAQIRTPKMTQERNSVLLTILLIALLAAAGLVLARRWIQRAG
jgi:hypothetical protein